MALNINKRQKRILIDNGYNSKNQLIAQWLWYFRKLLPENLYGFKINLKYSNNTYTLNLVKIR